MAMVVPILVIAGVVFLVLGLLVVLKTLVLGVAWWLLILVGVALIVVAVFLSARTGPRV